MNSSGTNCLAPWWVHLSTLSTNIKFIQFYALGNSDFNYDGFIVEIGILCEKTDYNFIFWEGAQICNCITNYYNVVQYNIKG